MCGSLNLTPASLKGYTKTSHAASVVEVVRAFPVCAFQGSDRGEYETGSWDNAV
jgi:hypothetical protein